MSRVFQTLAGTLVLACCAGPMACAPILPPTSLTQAEAMPQTKALKDAQESAPIAFAQAEKLRRQARAAFEAGDFASSQILAETALAAYDEAIAEARVSRAEDAGVKSQAEATKARERLAVIDAQQLEMQADINALEKQLRVLQELEIPRDSGKASAARAKARLAATRTLRLQAQLLCTAAGLLQGQQRGATREGSPAAPDLKRAKESLTAARAKVVELDGLLRSAPSQPPIDHAMRARASCLEALTLFRRVRNDVSKATGAADALLADLGRAGVGRASRDDRGVVVTLHDVFAGSALVADAGARLSKMTAAAAKHGALPLVVVLHQHQPLDDKSRAQASARGAALVAALRKRLAGVTIADVIVAGTISPIVDPEGRHKARNARVEIVFVTPEA